MFKGKENLLYIVGLALLVFLPVLIDSPFYLDMIVYIFLWAGLAGAWNIISGYAGQLSIGHAAFFGVGAYTSTLLHMTYDITPWAGMLIGGLVAVLFSVLIGSLTLRLRGPFFALATIAFAEILRIMAISWKGLTKGSLGILIPYEPGLANMIWGPKINYVFLMGAFMLAVYLISKAIEGSRFGYYLLALREDEDAAEALGIDTSRVKVTAMMVSAFLTGIGGTLYAQYTLLIEPASVFGIDVSVQMALISIIGSMNFAGGSIFGAFLLVPLSTFLRGWLTAYSGMHGFIYGLLLIIIVIFIPAGLLVKIQSVNIIRRRQRE